MTADELLATFDAIDRPLVSLPEDLPQSLSAAKWVDLDYLSWRDPTNAQRFFLCVPLPERTVGLIFRVAAGAAGHRGGLCDVCLAADRINGTTLATTESWTSPRTRHGLFVCADFDCNGSVRGLKWVDHMGETISTGQRIERMQRNLHAFVRRVTGLRAAAPAQKLDARR
jgi:hypothetical protein